MVKGSPWGNYRFEQSGSPTATERTAAERAALQWRCAPQSAVGRVVSEGIPPPP